MTLKFSARELFFVAAVLLLVIAPSSVQSFSKQHNHQKQQQKQQQQLKQHQLEGKSAISTTLQLDSNPIIPSSSSLSRRSFWKSASIFGATATGLWFNDTPSVLAAGTKTKLSQEEQDKANIVKGYKRLNYLLDNWEKETTVCKTGNDNPYLGCERTPMKVMEYLGYRSMNDPLFKAEKTMMRLEPLVPSKFESEYLDAMERWSEKADEGSGIAYISSWGESNPGGGKDRIAYFIERSKSDVIECRDILGDIVRILDLEKM
eukprot:CAMPEP_0202457100 /NCGR_PEP_ID=MMETSP1360-20130828/14194_1 /ASSEMBLY_ACC=CAM_ASM_000848 /TAXON_ID=515479 /ORGANISM="Licmophora paradoxa, Strain CCMP2313" /LENGTH=260 /DNA_ID=CAMNT_0049077089 /DNA_START=36 /DNA_END=818 /DNA_ORIENTATION=-